MADGQGRIVHFGERDCSLQGRYQEMVEEAPAAILSGETRARLHVAAIDLLAPIRYRNAGTVEFLYDIDRDAFYFMEVNARIQVEHPVSEAITGFDLVQLQLKVAGEGRLPVAQDEVRPSGHAIEVRIIAEDPDHAFAPSPGRVEFWRPPHRPRIRLH